MYIEVFAFLFSYTFLPLSRAQTANTASQDLAAMLRYQGRIFPERLMTHGCFCGGEDKCINPVDCLDQCCMLHDKCYNDIVYNEDIKENYDWKQTANGGIKCTDCESGGSMGKCAKCNCDKALALCLKKPPKPEVPLEIGTDVAATCPPDPKANYAGAGDVPRMGEAFKLRIKAFVLGSSQCNGLQVKVHTDVEVDDSDNRQGVKAGGPTRGVNKRLTPGMTTGGSGQEAKNKGGLSPGMTTGGSGQGGKNKGDLSPGMSTGGSGQDGEEGGVIILG